MKRKRNQQRLVAAVAGVGLGLVVQAYSQAAVNWSGPTTDNLWSNDANWGNTPVGGQDVIFGDTGTSTTAGTVTSIVDSDQTISSLLYNNTGTSFHTTQINAGVMIAINQRLALTVSPSRGSDRWPRRNRSSSMGRCPNRTGGCSLVLARPP